MVITAKFSSTVTAGNIDEMREDMPTDQTRTIMTYRVFKRFDAWHFIASNGATSAEYASAQAAHAAAKRWIAAQQQSLS